MVLRRIIILSALVLVVTVPTGILASQGPLVATVKAVKVVAQDSGKELFLPADEARPKDVIEYRLTYSNTGEEALKNVSVTDPIPTGTEYLTLTATRPEAGSVEFSIDGGKRYSSWPVRLKKTDEAGKELWVEATPDMVTHIRWTVTEDFEPETEITFTYRAIVK